MLVLTPPRRRASYLLFGALAVAAVVIPYGESHAVDERSWGALVAAVVAIVGVATARSLRRDAALELGALAVAAVLLALPLVGRLTVLRHGVIVTTIDPGLERALVVGGLACAAGVIAVAARAWWPKQEHSSGSREPAPPPG
jgi:hypothetical protein